MIQQIISIGETVVGNKNGKDWKRTPFTTNGDVKGSSFDDIAPGDWVELTQNGKYWNGKKTNKPAGAVQQPVQQSQPQQNTQAKFDTQDMIVRQNALTNARELGGYKGWDNVQIVTVAEYFANWVKTGEK